MICSRRLALTNPMIRSLCCSPTVIKKPSHPNVLGTFSSSASAPLRSLNVTSPQPSRPRLILGIETSCDDSCASIVSSDRTILSSIVTKQDHSNTSGIHPLTAALGHHSNLAPTISSAFTAANVAPSHIDAIAVTQGPGMASSLGVGLSAAKALAAVLAKPLIYVHHMQAHALTPLLTEKNPPQFPFLVLLISGGHTMIVLATSVTQFKILASTQDDSIGDAFDKVARDLGIPWTSAPGAALEQLAAQHAADAAAASDVGVEHNVVFPIPCKGRAEFSYSGLKAAVTRHIHSHKAIAEMDPTQKASIANAFQIAACAQLQDKLSMLLRPSHITADVRGRSYPRIILPDSITPDQIKTLVCSGGVASNHFLRSQLRKHLDNLERDDIQLQFPPLSLCTDNAAMIAWTGHLIWHQRIQADYSRHAKARWSIQDIPK